MKYAWVLEAVHLPHILLQRLVVGHRLQDAEPPKPSPRPRQTRCRDLTPINLHQPVLALTRLGGNAARATHGTK
ncbi:MAG TPA: hypothetical protein VNU46_07710 [Gemmatimonadaceae bacterium]|nr:hypothetical protein [Gemmatimonadaceae bacterium]